MLGIVYYLLTKVTSPSPALLESNPKEYARQLRHGGGKTLWAVLKYRSCPALGRRTCTRAQVPIAAAPFGATCMQPTLSLLTHNPFTKQQFEKLIGLYGYGFHVYRSGCHKPNYVDISLAQLVNYAATNTALKPVIESSSSISLLGRHGADIAPDKACEWVNDFVTSDR